ncbi:MAG: neutral/alkaline non-lysosomal ceramidase N-terminal domain-containing protein [Planctomycetales bacterium]|nr:neutral/alkaline non-lysosomal ceramidase N-terminal domain-containing protein [Planctomycetales bacterium]
MFHSISFVLCLLVNLACHSAWAADWMAGTASANITPAEPMWMSGYGSRDKVSEGKLTDLWAKALVLKDSAGTAYVIVTLDLVGIDRETSLAIRQGVCQRHGIELANISLFSSHTHTGPVVGTNLLSMYVLTEEQLEQVHQYTDRLVSQVSDTIDKAFSDLESAELSYGVGEATFAVNRRENPEQEVPQLRKEGKLKGPFDHRVPVFRVQAGERLKAVVFGYACHATVLSFYQWSGDYPGFAQMKIEASHPGTLALFAAGCGGDQNPLPRRTVELAEGYGQQLADAVESVLDDSMTPVGGELAVQYREIPIGFAELPERAELELMAQSEDHFDAGRAKTLLRQWDKRGELAADYPYPVQTCKFGDGPVWVVMGGEVVVDYALRVQQEFGDQHWTAGYANDVMAYIPSRRVLLEGGYEGVGAMRYYGQPSAWEGEIERKIIAEIAAQLAR